MSTQILWFATRGAGIVVAPSLHRRRPLGILGAGRFQRPGWPRALSDRPPPERRAPLARLPRPAHRHGDPQPVHGPRPHRRPRPGRIVVPAVLGGPRRDRGGPRHRARAHWAGSSAVHRAPGLASRALGGVRGLAAGARARDRVRDGHRSRDAIAVDALCAGAVAAATAWRTYVRRFGPAPAGRPGAGATGRTRARPRGGMTMPTMRMTPSRLLTRPGAWASARAPGRAFPGSPRRARRPAAGGRG